MEVNTQPGLTKSSLLPEMAKENGIDFFQLCETLIQELYAKNYNLIFFSLYLSFLQGFFKTMKILMKKLKKKSMKLKFIILKILIRMWGFKKK